MKTVNATSWCLVLLAGCGQAETGSPPAMDGPGIALTVAPLALAAVSDACYRVRVTAHDGAGQTQTVWEAANLCGARYGAGAAITYVGPCDASAASHTVTLFVEALCTHPSGCGTFAEATGWSNDDDSYVNPCGEVGCAQAGVVCEENADTLVEFDLTFMRSARQGFFDVSVDFEDVFCSAKLDCAYPQEGGSAADEEIALLHNPALPDQARDRTAVIAFACSVGAGSGLETSLAMTAITVSCAGGDGVVLDPSGEGLVDFASEAVVTNTNPLFGAAIYQGDELLAGMNKRYWNLALGYRATAASCEVSLAATVSEGASFPPSNAYPYIAWQVDLTDAGGARVCSQHPLDGQGVHAGVATRYGAVGADGLLRDGLGAPLSFGRYPAVASCADGLLNGAETGLDCGGACPGCADGLACVVDGDCQSARCEAGACVAPDRERANWPLPPDPPVAYTLTADVAVDDVTGLMWQRNAPADPIFDQPGALAYCAALELGGYDDWRLPTRIEILTLSDHTQSEPAINRVVFPNTIWGSFWTSTMYAPMPDGYVPNDPFGGGSGELVYQAWTGDFYAGSTGITQTDTEYWARCVRPGTAGPASSESRYVVAADVVSDPATGLTWQRAVPVGTLTWSAAQSYCAGLELGGSTDWRLPSIRELESLVDARTHSPAIDTTAFPGTPTGFFWASTVYVGQGGFAFYLLFYDGQTSLGRMDADPSHVRCVH